MGITENRMGPKAFHKNVLGTLDTPLIIAILAIKYKTPNIPKDIILLQDSISIEQYTDTT
jgi:hypothetical protein